MGNNSIFPVYFTMRNVPNHEPIASDIRRHMAQHQKIMLFHLTKHGVSTDKLQPLATYADFVLSSTNAKLITELVQGIHTKFALKGGKIGLA